MKVKVEIEIPDSNHCGNCDWIEIVDKDKYECYLFGMLDKENECKDAKPCVACMRVRKQKTLTKHGTPYDYEITKEGAETMMNSLKTPSKKVIDTLKRVEKIYGKTEKK